MDRRADLRELLRDSLISTLFWGAMLAIAAGGDIQRPVQFLIAFLVFWRFWRMSQVTSGMDTAAGLPYTCGFVEDGDTVLFVVATLHISPRSPMDAWEVIHVTNPDLVMVELDEERLGPMPPPPPAVPEVPRPRGEDLQPVVFTRPDSDAVPTMVHAQRAVWNAEWAGSSVRGRVVYDPENVYGLQQPARSRWEGHLALVRRGAASPGEFAAFAYKAHLAGSAGALAVLVIDSQSDLPTVRISPGTSVWNELELAWRTRNCGFPSLPVLLLPKGDGERLLAMCTESPTLGEFRVLEDSHPRRTLRRRVCQGCALFSSGIGMQYGVIDWFDVDIGGEFDTAVEAAQSMGVPSECIDVGMDAFLRRIGLALLPTPLNVLRALRAWLAFPRVLVNILFPRRGSIDTLGCAFLYVQAFTLRIWFAFLLGAFCASLVTVALLRLFSWGGAQAVEMTGAVDDVDAETTEECVLIALKMYIMPRLYDAVAASRDFTMYENIKAKARTHEAKRLVAVMGAAHANGVLQLAKKHGL